MPHITVIGEAVDRMNRWQELQWHLYDPFFGITATIEITDKNRGEQNACPEEEAQQIQFIKKTMLGVAVRELDLHDAVETLNACGIRSLGGPSWSTVELLDFLIPDDVTNPEMFAKIVIENFSYREGQPIAFEAGDSRCTVVRRSDMLGEAGYHDLTCEFR